MLFFLFVCFFDVVLNDEYDTKAQRHKNKIDKQDFIKLKVSEQQKKQQNEKRTYRMRKHCPYV